MSRETNPITRLVREPLEAEEIIDSLAGGRRSRFERRTFVIGATLVGRGDWWENFEATESIEGSMMVEPVGVSVNVCFESVDGLVWSRQMGRR